MIPMEMKKKRLEESTSSEQYVILESEDRLSNLPVELRRHIVSLLPVKAAVRTTILSKKWKRLCYSLPNLIFEFTRFPDVEKKLDCFLDFVDHMILHHDGSSIETFKLMFLVQNKSYTCLKDAWITFAVLKNVENLFLGVRLMETQKLPSCLFTSKSLKKLHLAIVGHVLKLPVSVDLPSLKELTLMNLRLFDDDSTQNLFSGCPALETLSIKTCGLSLVENLVFSGVHLKRLDIHNCDLSRLKVLSVYACNLKHLQIFRCFDLQKCDINLHTPSLSTFLYYGDIAEHINLENVSSPSSVGICFRKTNAENTIHHSLCAVKMLRGFCNMTKLSANEWFIEYLFSQSGVALAHLSASSFIWLKWAKLCMFPAKEHVQKAIALLTRFLNLHTLRIVISELYQPQNLLSLEMNYQDMDAAQLLNHLEYVEIENFKGQDSELEIVEFFLNHADVLVEMKIMSGRSYPPGCAVEMNYQKRTLLLSKVLAFRRASARAKILLS